MRIAKLNDTVTFQYKSSYKGEVFFNSAFDRDEPYKIKLGEGKMIPELEQALFGMKETEDKAVIVPPVNAYGLYKDEMVVVVDKSELPHDITAVAGMMIQGLAAGDTTINVYIRNVDGDKVTLDGNHRYAGKNIDFEVTLLMIED